MNKREFLKMVVLMEDSNLDDFVHELDGKRYGFRELDTDNWDDQGKYQYKEEKGKLVEYEANSYKILKEFNLGVTRSVQRSGSYFSDYHYECDNYEPFELTEVHVPEVIIPAHTKIQEEYMTIPKDIHEEIKEDAEAEREAFKLKQQLEEEEQKRQEELKKKYSMNDSKIIQRVAKKLRKKDTFTIHEMQQEYFNIVEKEGLKDAEWLDYHRKHTLGNN